MNEEILHTRLKNLVGDIRPDDLVNIDFALSDRFGVFVPSLGPCRYSITPDHTHPAYMIIANLHSSCRTRVGDTVIESEPGMLYFFSPGLKHHEITEEGSFNRYYAILAERDFFDSCALMYTESVPFFSGEAFPLPERIVSYLIEYMDEYERADDVSSGQMALLEERVVHFLARAAFEKGDDRALFGYTGTVDKALHFMHTRFSSELTLEEIAAGVSMSPSHFLRLFKKATDRTPMEFLKCIRLEKARKLLVRTDRNLTQIAFDCGFNSSSYFSTAFVSEYGITPSEYRRQNI